MQLKHFSLAEFDCKETGENAMDLAFLESIDLLRETCGFPFVITSGYRSPEHSVEKAKSTPGTHSKGIAADIKCADSSERFDLLDAALMQGFTGIGIAKDFVHLDMRTTNEVVWVY